MSIEILVTLDPSWQAAAPGTVVGVLALRDVRNPERHDAINQLAADLETELRARFAGQDRAAIQATPPFPAYAAYYKRFGQRYHVGLQVESVALKGKPLPRVAALVEAMFIAELRHGILTAGHDLGALTLPVRLGVGSGEEAFTKPNGETATVKAGDTYTATAAGVLSAIITGPSSLGRISATTTAALFVAYAPPGVDPDQVEAHLAAIEANIRLVAPNAVTDAHAVIVAHEAM
jgi:DNA/RNA-binding domain of Phe-tRNA-synthetase-like protein